MKKLKEIFGDTEIRNIIAIISVIGCYILLYLLIIKPMPPENKDVVLTAVGFVFGGLLGGVTGYFFGSSKKDNEPKQPTQ